MWHALCQHRVGHCVACRAAALCGATLRAQHCAMQHCALSTVQCSTVRCSTVQCSTARPALCYAALRVQHCAMMQHCVQHCMQHRIALHCKCSHLGLNEMLVSRENILHTDSARTPIYIYIYTRVLPCASAHGEDVCASCKVVTIVK